MAAVFKYLITWTPYLFRSKSPSRWGLCAVPNGSSSFFCCWLFSTLILKTVNKNPTHIDRQKRIGAIFIKLKFSKECFDTSTEPCVRRLDREGVGIHPGVLETTLEIVWLCEWGALPSLNTLREQCIKRCTWTCKTSHTSWHHTTMQSSKQPVIKNYRSTVLSRNDENNVLPHITFSSAVVPLIAC